AGNKIRIADEGAAECDQIGIAATDCGLRHFGAVAVVDNPAAAEAAAQRTIIETRAEVAVAAGLPFDQMDIDEVEAVELLDDILEQRLRIAVASVIGGCDRREPDAGTPRPDLAGHRLSDLQHQARPVLD